MSKTVPVSVRLSVEDAEFIANFQTADAMTPSDKIRSIIKDARLRKDRILSYESCLLESQNAVRTLMQHIKACELESGHHSELLNVFNEWITESFAYVASAKLMMDEGRVSPEALEAGIAVRAFRLLSTMARMGVTTKAPCYDTEIMTKGFKPILELIHIINQRLTKGE